MIRIEKLSKSYGRRRNANQVLRNIDLTLPDTGFVCILGPSGCGKTSLLNAVGGLDAFDHGIISTENVSTDRYGKALFEAERNRSFGYIFQNYYLLSDHSVGYNVYLGLHSLELSHDEKLQRVEEALRAVEMERYFCRNVAELSGGQQQRVAIARALARRPRVIFADEPTGNLDEANTMNICSLLRKISKTSLVVMVTHEERIARFFADRIISLEDGVISADSDSFQRGSLTDSGTLYTGDYAETILESSGIRVRFYQQEGSGDVDISILALQDRIVIKLSDGRTVSCGQPKEQPVVVSGQRPHITLEELEQEHLDWQADEEIPAKAGKGLRFRDMFRQAWQMTRQKGMRNLGTRMFLIVLTVLTALTAVDLITLLTVDPRDYVTTHSQVLEVSLERGSGAESAALGFQSLGDQFKSYLSECGQEYHYAPVITGNASVSGSTILQTNDLSVTFSDFTYTPLDYLEESSLILGRMPENQTEIVVDRWVLDEVLAQDGVAQNGITGIDYFLNKQVSYSKQSFSPVIVGICDSGEPAVYLMDATFANLGAGGTPVATLSSLQKAYPGVYDDLELEESTCMVLPANAGSRYNNMLYANYTVGTMLKFQIVKILDETTFYAGFIIADDELQSVLYSMSPQRFYIFCENKEEMTAYLQSIPEKMGNAVTVSVKDSYSETMEEYRQSSQLRADARTIVTATVMVLCAVMLYLLRRAQVLDRIGMLSVYRLLGISRRKTTGIFCMESLLGGFCVITPTVIAVWIVVKVLELFEVLKLVFPWQAGLLVVAVIALFHLLVTLLPLCRLLRLPPAQLAAKYDF